MAVCALALALLGLVAVSAVWATSGSRTAHAGAGNSWQQLSWNDADTAREMQIRIRPDPSLSDDQCLDGHLDWDTNGTGHYDARVVRTCAMNGVIHITNPSGDTWFEEPLGAWNDRNIAGVQRGVGYLIDDDDDGHLEIEGTPDFVYGGGQLYGGGPAPVTTAGADMFAKLWTRYQSGNEVVKNANPHTCAFPATDPRC